MYSEPNRAEYSSYENYALAVLGYIVLRGGLFGMGGFSGVRCDGGFFPHCSSGFSGGFDANARADVVDVSDSVEDSSLLRFIHHGSNGDKLSDARHGVASVGSEQIDSAHGGHSDVDGVDSSSVVDYHKKGPNYERNKLNREKQKERKRRRRFENVGNKSCSHNANDTPSFKKRGRVSDVTSVHTAGPRSGCARNLEKSPKDTCNSAFLGKSEDHVHDSGSGLKSTRDDVVVQDATGKSSSHATGIKKDDSDHPNGFWSSCSSETRQQLIDSKARMHIAENIRKAEEAERRVKQLNSPEQILRDAMRMVNFANEQAKKQNDAKIYGWAKTVAESYAETIAKSAPTSVESFESFVQSNSSITSVSLDVFNEVLKRKDELEKEVERLKIENKPQRTDKSKSSVNVQGKRKKFDLCAGTLKDGKVVKSAKVEDRLQDIIDAGMAGSSQFAGVDFGRFSYDDEEYFG